MKYTHLVFTDKEADVGVRYILDQYRLEVPISVMRDTANELREHMKKHSHLSPNDARNAVLDKRGYEGRLRGAILKGLGKMFGERNQKRMRKRAEEATRAIAATLSL